MAQAFSTVARESFVGPGPWWIAAGSGYIRTPSADPDWLYQDLLVGLDVRRRINNGQPSLHARCMAALDPRAGDMVVHVGCGTGYYTAVLSVLVGAQGRVLALEIDEVLARTAHSNLQAFRNVEVRQGSAVGSEIPACDAMYVNAGVTELPSAWLDALRLGGRLMVPLTTRQGLGIALCVERKSRAEYSARALEAVSFTPCVGTGGERSAHALEAALESTPWHRIRSLRRFEEPDDSAWCIGDGWWLSTQAPRASEASIRGEHPKS